MSEPIWWFLAGAISGAFLLFFGGWLFFLLTWRPQCWLAEDGSAPIPHGNEGRRSVSDDLFRCGDGKKISLTKLMTTVSIQFECMDEYTASVFYEELLEKMQRGECVRVCPDSKSAHA